MAQNYNDTINLPKTDFPMRAGLPQQEPKMLEKWENEGVSKLLGGEKESIISKAHNDSDVLDLNAPILKPEKVGAHKNQYDTFFED